MAMETVAPLRQRGEIFFVAIATAVIISVVAGVINIKKGSGEAPKKLKGYQISGISDLTGNNQSIYTDLYTAALDIEFFHQKNEAQAIKWPPVEQMEADQISPFVRDQMWESRGQLSWKEQVTGLAEGSVHTKAYIGKSTNLAIAGSFLVLFEHYHSSDGTYYLAGGKTVAYSIWYRSDKFDLPATITEGTLVTNGWKEVVSFTGKDQRKELNR